MALESLSAIRNRFDRVALGAAMSVLAWLIERIVLRSSGTTTSAR